MDAIDLTPTAGGVVIIATNPAAALLPDALRGAGYAGPLRIVEDVARPLPSLPERLRCERISVAASGIGALAASVSALDTPLGCTIGWHGVFSRALVEAFQGRLLNVHAGDLPRYRGAGGGSWQVMNGESRAVVRVQQMRLQLDRGPILHGEHEALPERPYPSDVKRASQRATVRALHWLATAIAEGRRVPLQPQDERVATYFPRLNSAVDGWLEFSWTALAVERFVRAFSDPYPGASFRYRGDAFRARRAWEGGDGTRFHPYCHGLVVNRTDEALHVVVADGVVCLGDIVDMAGEPVPLQRFAVGARLFGDGRAGGPHRE